MKVRDVIRMLEQDGYLREHEEVIASTNILLN
jgi:hypothetical protein